MGQTWPQVLQGYFCASTCLDSICSFTEVDAWDEYSQPLQAHFPSSFLNIKLNINSSISKTKNKIQQYYY